MQGIGKERIVGGIGILMRRTGGWAEGEDWMEFIGMGCIWF